MKMLLMFAIGISFALTSMVGALPASPTTTVVGGKAASGDVADPAPPKSSAAPTVHMDDVRIVKSPSNWSIPRDLSQHDFVTIYHGYNDGKVPDTVVSAMMGNLRSANAKMWIFVMVPYSGRAKTPIVNGVADYLSKHPTETKIKVIDTSEVRIQTSDGIHPTPGGAEVLAQFMISPIQGYLDREVTTTRSTVSSPASTIQTTSGDVFHSSSTLPLRAINDGGSTRP